MIFILFALLFMLIMTSASQSIFCPSQLLQPDDILFSSDEAWNYPVETLSFPDNSLSFSPENDFYKTFFKKCHFSEFSFHVDNGYFWCRNFPFHENLNFPSHGNIQGTWWYSAEFDDGLLEISFVDNFLKIPLSIIPKNGQVSVFEFQKDGALFYIDCYQHRIQFMADDGKYSLQFRNPEMVEKTGLSVLQEKAIIPQLFLWRYWLKKKCKNMDYSI